MVIKAKQSHRQFRKGRKRGREEICNDSETLRNGKREKGRTRLEECELWAQLCAKLFPGGKLYTTLRSAEEKLGKTEV